MLTKLEIKEKLNLKDNIYLDKYLQLVNENKTTKYIKYKTQVHHIIPKYYYKENNLKIDESIKNKVNLLYTDHLKAHCYLALCSKNQINIYGNFCAIIKLLGNNIANKYNISYFTLEDFLDSLNEDAEYIQEIYTSYKTYQKAIYPHFNKTQTEKQIFYNNLSNKLKDRITIHKCGCEKKIDKDYLELYMNDGWEIGRDPEIKEKNIEATKKVNTGRKAKNKGVPMSNEAKQKWKTKMQLRKENGIKNKPCSEHRKKAISEANKGRIYIYKDDNVKSIHSEELNLYLNKGWIIGNPNAATCTGKIWINDGQKNYLVDKEEAEKMILSGRFFKGSCKESKTKNSIWINNGSYCKRISTEELESYLADGWVKGFLNSRWLKENTNE